MVVGAADTQCLPCSPYLPCGCQPSKSTNSNHKSPQGHRSLCNYEICWRHIALGDPKVPRVESKESLSFQKKSWCGSLQKGKRFWHLRPNLRCYGKNRNERYSLLFGEDFFPNRVSEFLAYFERHRLEGRMLNVPPTLFLIWAFVDRTQFLCVVATLPFFFTITLLTAFF